MQRLCRRYLQQSFFWGREIVYRKERRYPAFKEAKLCTYRTCLLSSNLIATCVSPWGFAGNPHHVAPGTPFPTSALTGCNTPIRQHVEPSRRYKSIPTKVSSPTWPRWSTQRQMTWSWRGLRGGKGFWFMTCTAVEKDQNVTLRVTMLWWLSLLQ